MTVMGVFSSWLASVMNCFCFRLACTTGSMARREQSTTMRYTSATHPAMTASDKSAVVMTERSCWELSRKTAIQRSSATWTTR